MEKGTINQICGRVLDEGKTPKENALIEGVLGTIKEQIGLELEPCPYFKGVYYYMGRRYFNVELKERCSESQDYVKLQRWANAYEMVKLEPNGVNRVAVFF